MGNQKMLPAVVFNNQVAIALLFEPVLNFLGNVWLRIHVILDRPFLADEGLKLGLPTLHQNADFRKLTLRRRLHEGCIHIALIKPKIHFKVQTWFA